MLPIGFCLVTFGTSYSDLRRAAQHIDALGFDSIWVWDHYVSWNDPREPVLEGWTTLAALAEATQRVRIGPLVANNSNRHPGRLAKVVATLQEISGGRVELGLGAGGLEHEQTPFGIEQGSPGERVARMEEALQIIPALWSGESVTFAGQYYQLTDAIVSPPPRPHPRLIVGANGPKMAHLAGHYADGLNLQWRRRDQFPLLLAALDAGLAASGRTRTHFDLSLHPDWRDLARDPAHWLVHWQKMGFSRIIPYLTPPFPLDGLSRLAELLQQ
ncbi:MAG: LLM class flavin-dependent oxidoreductase [Chloroflexaceae bacterium]|nr:LLM class flavin-dependent oxidoreductase [Chloroflexaceae bacterium]NJO05714.1 LLM class flavin-dependent oxidoreductase [Chloroflexaceae bacterium]